MPLRRLILLEPSNQDGFREARDTLRGVLSGKGIAVVPDAADGFIAAPGSLTSLSELFTNYLAGNDLPCGLLNTANYYTDLLKTTEDSVVDRFVRETQRGRLIVQRDPHDLVQAMVEYLPPETRRQSAAIE